MEIMLIGWGTGVAVGVGTTSVGVNNNVGVNVFVAVAVSVSGATVLTGITACVAQAVTNSAIVIKTNKVFFISELLAY
jgi:hypothetical protein